MAMVAMVHSVETAVMQAFMATVAVVAPAWPVQTACLVQMEFSPATMEPMVVPEVSVAPEVRVAPVVR